ncbi:MAG: MFS transporter [Promethearchaeota archaeon]
MGIHTVRAVFIPYDVIWGGLTFFQIMILQSYFTFMIFLFEIPSGAIADFLGRNRALTLSALSLIFATIFYCLVPNLWLFFIGETFWALGIALRSGTDEAFLYTTLKALGKEKELPKYMARNRTMYIGAQIISAPLGSIIAIYISLHFTMVSLGLVYVLAFIFSFSLKEPHSKKKTHKSNRYLNIIKDGYKELKRNKILRILCLDRVLIESLIFILFWTYQIYLGAVNVPISFFGFVASAINVVNLIFLNVIPMISKRIKNKLKLLILVDIICGIAYIFMGFIFNAILGILLILTIVATGYPRYLIYINGINKQVESENRATVLSTINMFTSFLRAITLPFIGIILEWNVFIVFIFIGGLIILLTILTRVKNDYL